jgi:flagellin
MRISSNVSAMQALKSMSRTTAKLQTSSIRLSSGTRVNSSADGPSDVAISNKLQNQLIGLEGASKNASTGISVVQTADGALSQIHDMLQRIRELAVYASNDTQESDDRVKIQLEIENLIEEVDGIANKTEFNRIKIIGGHASRIIDSKMADVLRVSDTIPDGNYKYTVTATASQTINTLGDLTLPIPDGTIRINGVRVEFDGTESAEQAYEKIREAADYSDITLSAFNGGVNGTPLFNTMTFDEFGSKYEFEITGESSVLSALGLSNGVIAQGTDAQISFEKYPLNELSVSATYTSSGNRVTISDSKSKEIVFDIKADFITGTLPTLPYSQSIILDKGPIVLHLGPSKDMNIVLDIPKVSASSLEIDKVDVRTLVRAQDAIDQVDSAISLVSKIRAKVGTYQNRLEYSITSLDITAVNTEQSLSRIRDTDMALEMSNYSKFSVINQAAISILAQANQRPQAVLQLLQ